MDLQKVAQEQQTKLAKDREERKEQIKAASVAPPPAPTAAELEATKELSKNADHSRVCFNSQTRQRHWTLLFLFYSRLLGM